MQSRGLGDTVAKFTKFTRLDKLAKFVAKALGYEDCGCERRRDKLNKRFSYKNKK